MKKVFCLILILFLVFLIPLTVYAHPGRTDGRGGHTNNSTGEYHYHHGYSAHDHYDMDGDGTIDCPYNFVDKTRRTSSTSNSTSSNKTTEPVKTEEPSKKAEIDAGYFVVFPFALISLYVLVKVSKMQK